MGMNTHEVGGGPATGLANDFVGWLQNGLQTGSFGSGTAGQRYDGANPVGQTQGISNVLNDLLSGGAGKIGGSFASTIQHNVDENALALRERFGGTGTGYGTGAGYAEGVLRSQAAPQITQAIGGLQTGLIQSLLPIFANLASKGITQRETVSEPSTGMNILNGVTQVAQAVSSFIPGGGARSNPDSSIAALSGLGSNATGVAPITAGPINYTPSYSPMGFTPSPIQPMFNPAVFNQLLAVN